MSKLFKLKEWLSLEDASEYISRKLEEPVTVHNLYEMALENHLVISIFFVNQTYGAYGRVATSHDNNHRQTQKFEISKEPIVRLENLWDLAMVGNEVAEMKKALGLHVMSSNDNGIILTRGEISCRLYKYYEPDYMPDYEFDDSKRARLHDEARRKDALLRKDENGLYYLPCSQLSDIQNTLCIKSVEIERFIRMVLESPVKGKPLKTNERQSLLVLIAALCKESGVDWNQRGVTPAVVKLTELIGAPLSEDTVRRVLSKIDSALDSKCN